MSFCIFFLVIFYSCHILYQLHLLPYQQGKFHLEILPIFPRHFSHSFHIFYHLHLLIYQQGVFHMGVLPPFPHLIFIFVIYFITHTFININKRGVIVAFWLFFLVIFSLLSYFLSLTPSSISTGEVSSGHSTSFSSSFFFILVVFSILYTFLHLNKRSFI